MNVELDPPQPDGVARALASLLEDAERDRPDPWWQAGMDEAFEDSA